MPARDDAVTVLVVDDNREFRAVLREVVTATPGMTLIGDAVSGEAALEALPELAPRLVIMDKRMPGIGGIEATRQMLQREPRLVVFLVSVENPTSTALEVSGAAAFLDKRRLSTRALAALWEAYGR